MPSNIKAQPEKNVRGAPNTRDMPHPLINLSDAAVKELIRSANNRGDVTVDQINSVLPSKEANSEQIKDILSVVGEMGVNVIEANEAEPEKEMATGEEPEEEAEGELVEVQQRPVPAKFGATEPGKRTDDPVRMYLREMGSMELLSREGEIAVAKRIQAGREAMIAGLCESPLTFQAIIIWRDELGRAAAERARQLPGQEQQRKNPQGLASIRAPIYEEKVVDFLLELATVTDKTVSHEELFKADDEEASA